MIYRRATDALKKADVPLDVAAIQFARSITNSKTSGANSAGAFLPTVPSAPTIKAVSVAKVMNELLASKRAKGRSELYLTDLRIRLTRFAKACKKRPLCEITSEDIDTFLESLGIAARSQNNFRSTIGTLIRFGKAKGYVARDHPGVSHVDKASHTALEVQVFTPEQMEKLLGGAKNELVPAIALGGFAGIRSEELKRLTWEDIHLKEGHIEIKSAKSKTRVRRLIPIQENLTAWLHPYAKKTGVVVPFANLALQFGKLSRRAGVKWKKNGLRHSFISYRTALTTNIPMVSLEAGNSPAVISRNYLKCVSSGEALRWFSILPKEPEQTPAASNGCSETRSIEQWANAGWQQMQKESHSPEGRPEQAQRSLVGPSQPPGVLVPAGGADPAPSQTMQDPTQDRHFSNNTA
ncbi:MAG: tyrosine-type recombinase/integrase [Candidatus Omnitrophica bacterium]|nr:tyrosine-type recombinase/integrase [Candidatus Omnitrophota bacterium]